MSKLPEDLYQEILVRLPAKSLLVCRFVCKNWYSLISSSYFVKLHLNFTVQKKNPSLMIRGINEEKKYIWSIRYDALSNLNSDYVDDVVEMDYPFKSLGCFVQLLCSCDGLVCLWVELEDVVDEIGEFICLWNPCTKEYKKIPKSPNEASQEDIEIYALGYDYKIDDYKLIRGFQGHDQDNYVVDIYTLGSNSWKTIEHIPYRFPFIEMSGVLVNGNLHWLGTKFPFEPIQRMLVDGTLYLDTQIQDISTSIICLDISSERFEDMALPKDTLKKRHVCTCVGMLEECLCVLVDDGSKLDVWVMQNYGVEESWTKRFSITIGLIRECWYLHLMWSFKNDEILLVSYHDLILYDPIHASAKQPMVRSLTLTGEAENYVESLVSLHSGTYVGR